VSRTRRDHDLAKTLAALLGAPIAAFLLGASLSRLLPFQEDAAFAWGVHVIAPLWVCLAVLLPLARDGRRAWAYCLLVALPAAAFLALCESPHGRPPGAVETAR
jgi:hypothetical protein